VAGSEGCELFGGEHGGTGGEIRFQQAKDIEPGHEP